MITRLRLRLIDVFILQIAIAGVLGVGVFVNRLAPDNAGRVISGTQFVAAIRADRPTPPSTFRFRKGKEAQRAVHDRNDDIAEKLHREERKPDNLHCEGKCVVEQPHQDRNDETQDVFYGERDDNKWDDNHIVERAAEAAVLGPFQAMVIGHD